MCWLAPGKAVLGGDGGSRGTVSELTSARACLPYVEFGHKSLTLCYDFQSSKDGNRKPEDRLGILVDFVKIRLAFELEFCELRGSASPDQSQLFDSQRSLVDRSNDGGSHMRQSRSVSAVVLLVGFLFIGGAALAQERVAARPTPATPTPESGEPQPEVFVFDDPAEAFGAQTEIVAANEGTVEALHTPTPAADVSAGTFGADVGGGIFNIGFRLGIGTTTPIAKIHVLNSNFVQEAVLDTSGAFGSNFYKSRGTVEAKTLVQSGDTVGILRFFGWDGTQYRQTAFMGSLIDGSASSTDMPGRLVFATVPDGSLSPVERMRITNSGNIGIGTGNPAHKLHVNGNAFVSGTLTGGNITAHYQDIAEWVKASIDLNPGDVVVLNHEAVNEVMPSSSAYDTRVAGVVSEQPGLTLGVAGDAKEMIATTGRVKVRVDATSAPIRVGDLLVTSDKAGFAMKSIPMEFNGRQMHQPGTIIGKALENLEDGEGTILVLLSMQ